MYEMEKIVIKSIIFAYFLIVYVHGEEDANAKILEYKNKQDVSGNYKFSFKTSNGIDRSEVGTIEGEGGPNEHYVVTGQYFYISPDGTLITVYYTADENGYRVSNKPPPPVLQRPIEDFYVPPAVVASLLG